MSTTAAAPQQPQQPPALPDPKTAYDTLVRDVYARTFFGRLAAHGLQPQSEKQAEDLLAMAGKLRVIAEDDRVKAAEAANDPIARANQSVDGLMRRMGIGGHDKAASAQAATAARRQAAVRLAGDPALYNAALSYKAAVAQHHLQQQG